MIGGLGIDRHPDLSPEYFRHYCRIVHLAQDASGALIGQARQIGARLGLAFEHRFTGYGELGSRLGALAERKALTW